MVMMMMMVVVVVIGFTYSGILHYYATNADPVSIDRDNLYF